MRPKEHLSLAAKIGIGTGSLVGTVDALVRIAAWSFQWFEIYQTVLFHALLFLVVFVFMGLFLEGVMRLRNRYGRDVLERLYSSLVISLLLILYTGFILGREGLLHPYLIGGGGSLYIFVAALTLSGLLIFIYLLTKGRDLLERVVAFWTESGLGDVCRNIVFVVLLFASISLAGDVARTPSIPQMSGPQQTGDRPNVLLISIDTLRADHMSLYGYHRNTTPNIDEFSEDAVVFENAISTSSWTLPGHASMLTGKYPSGHGATRLTHLLPEEETTLAERLKEEGYVTAGLISGQFVTSRYRMHQGFDLYRDRLDFIPLPKWTLNKFSLQSSLSSLFPETYKAVFGSDEEKKADETTAQALEWLDKNSGQRFFLFLHYMDPHDPYEPPESFREDFEIRESDLQGVRRKVERYSPDDEVEERTGDIASMERRYDGEIRYTDHHLGRVFDKLEEEGLMEDTIIVVTSDHGEEFYDHGSFLHNNLYQEDIHVPLVVRYPGGSPSGRVRERASLVDIAPTALDTTGMEIPADMDGRSLTSVTRNGGGRERYHFAQLFGRERYGNVESDEAAVLSPDGWKLIEVNPERDNMKSSLFNLREDPREWDSLIDTQNSKKEMLREVIRDSGMIGSVPGWDPLGG